MRVSILRPFVIVLFGLLAAAAAHAATIWGGPKITFTKPSGADITQPANQDRLTPKVWLTRGDSMGLFNVATEMAYDNPSPADTEWAYGTTASFATLTYKPWADWHGKNPPSAIDQEAVLHLISDDIYIDIRMTAWSERGGGGFAYVRSTPGGSTPASIPVVEYYNASLDHYFITWVPDEISKLDEGTVIKGWVRTGQQLRAYNSPQAGTSPVCRFYIPPELGDSHFFGRGKTECDNTGAKNPSFVLEDPAFMQMFLPVGGVCPAGTTQVYRVFSNRLDANHRYMTDKSIRDRMVTLGWLAEGDGPDLVVMCAPQ